MITDRYQKLDIKCRLWMFAQSENQLIKAYGYHADSIIGFTGVRCYINPAQKDYTAKDVSDMVDFRGSVLGGCSVLLATEHDLVEKRFMDKQVVFGDGAPPAKLTKRFASSGPAVKICMGEARDKNPDIEN